MSILKEIVTYISIFFGILLGIFGTYTFVKNRTATAIICLFIIILGIVFGVFFHISTLRTEEKSVSEIPGPVDSQASNIKTPTPTTKSTAIDNLVGYYDGTYTINEGTQGTTHFGLQIYKITADKVEAKFSFYFDPEDTSVSQGEYLMNVAYDSDSNINLKGYKWIENPFNYGFADLKAILDGDTLSGEVLYGNGFSNSGEVAGTFQLKKRVPSPQPSNSDKNNYEYLNVFPQFEEITDSKSNNISIFNGKDDFGNQCFNAVKYRISTSRGNYKSDIAEYVIKYKLDKKYTTLSTSITGSDLSPVGLPAISGEDSVRIKILADGKVLQNISIDNQSGQTKPIELSLENVDILELNFSSTFEELVIGGGDTFIEVIFNNAKLYKR